jgi:hypothetical protein
MDRSRRNFRVLNPGDRVKHNYTDGHGKGVVLSRKGDGSGQLAYIVKYDNVKEAMPYTFNSETQEIVPLRHQHKKAAK